jgi:hypothetical protein
MRVLGIDPGFNACGVAYFDGKVWDTCTVRPEGRGLLPRALEIRKVLAGLPADLVVIERPQVYTQRLMKGDPNDEVSLAVLIGYLAAGFDCPVLLPLPGTWKGQVPKKIHHDRLRKRIPDLGRCSSDAMDAVGLALYGLENSNARSST